MTTPAAKRRYEEVVQRIIPAGELLRVWALAGGISATMTALEVVESNGQSRRIVVRRHSQTPADAVANEFRLLQILQAQGMAVPKPCHLDCSGEIFPDSYLVIEYVEGEMDFAPADMHHYVRQLAMRLAEIHGVNRASCDLSFLCEKTNECPEMHGEQAVGADESFDEVRIRDALAAVGPLLTRNESTLLHGDFWPGNILWHHGDLVAVIDWEDAELGDPLMDFAKARAEIVWIFGIDAFEAFTSQYRALMAIDYTDLPYWDLCATLRFLRFARSGLGELVAFFTPYGRKDISEDTIRNDYRYFIDQAFAALDT